MPDESKFQEIYAQYRRWVVGIFFQEIRHLGTADLWLSGIPSEYFSFGAPTVAEPALFDIQGVEDALAREGKRPAVVLTEAQQALGFPELLVRRGYVLDNRDAWLIFQESADRVHSDSGLELREIGLDDFGEYTAVMARIFPSFSGRSQYSQMEHDFMLGTVRSPVADLKLRIYAGFDGGKIVAAGAMFWSQAEKFCYLHDGGTLEEFRGRGYQQALIQKRVDDCLKMDTERIYVSTEQGTASWRNCIKSGFEHLQTFQLFTQ